MPLARPRSRYPSSSPHAPTLAARLDAPRRAALVVTRLRRSRPYRRPCMRHNVPARPAAAHDGRDRVCARRPRGLAHLVLPRRPARRRRGPLAAARHHALAHQETKVRAREIWWRCRGSLVTGAGRPRNPVLISLCLSWWLSAFPCLLILCVRSSLAPARTSHCVRDTDTTLAKSQGHRPRTTYASQVPFSPCPSPSCALAPLSLVPVPADRARWAASR